MDDEEIVRQSHVKTLLGVDGAHDVLPVGSRGILYEAKEIAKSEGLRFIESGEIEMDLMKSAGPSTCALVSVRAPESQSIARGLAVPVTNLGKLVAP